MAKNVITSLSFCNVLISWLIKESCPLRAVICGCNGCLSFTGIQHLLTWLTSWISHLRQRHFRLCHCLIYVCQLFPHFFIISHLNLHQAVISNECALLSDKQCGLHTEPKLFAGYVISQPTETFSAAKMTNCLLFHYISQGLKYFVYPAFITTVQSWNFWTFTSNLSVNVRVRACNII